MSDYINNNAYSKSREGAKVFSRLANTLQYEQDNVPAGIIGGTNTVGSTSLEQAKAGVKYPTVQAAIDDIANSMVIPVNGILETTEDLNPAGSPSVERLTFTGTASSDNVLVYGYKIPVTQNDDNDTVTTKVTNWFNTNLVANSILISDINVVSTNVIEIEFLDNRNHEETSDSNNGITITGERVVDARGGFGTWIKLGEYEKFTGVTVYAWKRTS